VPSFPTLNAKCWAELVQCYIVERSANTDPQQSHLSQHTGFVHIKVTFYSILSCFESTMMRNEHFPLSDEATFTGCINLRVCPICICIKWTISVSVKAISEQLIFTHLHRSTLYGPQSWNNKSTYGCQLILYWSKLTQFTFPSHTACLGFTSKLPCYSRCHRGISNHIINGNKVAIRIVIFS